MLYYKLPAIIIIFVYLITIIFLHRKYKYSLNQHIIYCVFCIYFIAVISVTIFPFPYQKSLIDSFISHPKTQYQNNFIPFHSIIEYIKSGLEFGSYMTIGKQVAGNIIMFIPLGIYLPFVRKNITIRKVLLVGVLASLAIETLQFTLNKIIGIGYRAADVDDLILNTVGTLVGFAITKLVFIFNRKLRLILKNHKQPDTKLDGERIRTGYSSGE